jgi:hypothetical protein
MDPDLDSDLDPDPAIFVIDLQGNNQKTNICKKKFFCVLLFKGRFTSFLKDKKSKRSHNAVGIKVFLLFLLGDGRIRIRSLIWIHTAD